MVNDTACLLLHGFAGTPFDLEACVPVLENLGCTVDLPTLPGHGSSVEEFRKTFFTDWMSYAEERYLLLSRSYKHVIPIGFSMGGSLALFLAIRHSPAGLVSISAPVYIHPYFPFTMRTLWYIFLPLLKRIRPVIPRRPSLPESREIAPYKGYEDAVYLPQLHSLSEALVELRQGLPDIHCPTLIMHDSRDTVSWPGSALVVASKASSSELTLRYTRIQETITSHHMLTTHRETRDQVKAEIAAFVAGIIEKGEGRKTTN